MSSSHTRDRPGSPRVATAVALVLLALPPAVQAGAPLITDDADVIEAKSCQFEAWAWGAHGAREYWAVPACNFTGNLELSLGVGGVNPDGEPASTQFVLHGKTVFYKADDDAWSVGAVAGVGYDSRPVPPAATSTGYYAKALLTLNPVESLEVDLNLGASNDFGAGATVAARRGRAV